MIRLKNQSGLVSLVSTIIVGIFLMIVALGAASANIIEQRQADDLNQSQRAFAAAEAGVEDAVWRLQLPGSVTANQNCLQQDSQGYQAAQVYLPPPLGVPKASSGDLGDGSGITCQRITLNTNTKEGFLAREQTLQLDLPSGSFSSGSVKLEWDLDGSGDSPVVAGYSFPGAYTPAGGSWSYPAAPELTATSYAATIDNSGVNGGGNQAAFKAAIAMPSTSGSTSNTAALGSPTGNPPSNGYCSPSLTSYHCVVTFTGFDNSRGNIIRLRPRYTGMHYRLTFSGNIPDQTATIDVTARAGQIYRRVIAKVPLRSGVPTGLDYVIYGDQNVCKNFKVDPTSDKASELAGGGACSGLPPNN